MIEFLDYVLDLDDNFWIVNNVTSEGIFGYMVYKKDDNGDRYNNFTKLKYTKQYDNYLIRIPKYKKVYKPRDCFKNHLNEIPLIWRKYVEALENVGIDDIGIFGSFLIGFDPIKDIDFVIYGLDNYKKYYDNILYIRNYIGATSITPDHINKQYNKHKNNYSDKCDLKKIISRNWSGVELKNGVLSTPRFVIDGYISPIKKGIDATHIVEIIDGTLSDFVPRRAKALLDGIEFEIISPIWKFQSFARDKDKMEIYGNYDFNNHVIILDERSHYIKYI